MGILGAFGVSSCVFVIFGVVWCFLVVLGSFVVVWACAFAVLCALGASGCFLWGVFGVLRLFFPVLLFGF